MCNFHPSNQMHHRDEGPVTAFDLDNLQIKNAEMSQMIVPTALTNYDETRLSVHGHLNVHTEQHKHTLASPNRNHGTKGNYELYLLLALALCSKLTGRRNHPPKNNIKPLMEYI